MESLTAIKYVTEGLVLLIVLAFILLLAFRPKSASKKALAQKGILSPDNELYLPYKREDRYGLLGAKPQPLSEYARLAVLAVTVVPLKFTGAFLSLLALHLMCRHVPSRLSADEPHSNSVLCEDFAEHELCLNCPS